VTGINGLIAVDKVGNKIRFYDPQSLQEISQFNGPEPCVHELAVSHDHKLAFVPLYGDGIYGSNRNPNNKVLVIDLVRQELASVIALGEFLAPHGMVATADGMLWVVCDISNKLLLIDPAKGTIATAYDCPAKGPHLVALTPDETKLYVSSKEGDLCTFDLAQRKFVAALPMRAAGVASGNGSGSEGLMPTPDGRWLLVIDNDRNDLHAIDIASNREIDRVPLTLNALSNVKRSRLCKLMFSPDGSHLVATSYASGLAWVIDPADLRRQTLVPVAKGPQGMTFPPDGKTVLVSSHDSGLLTRIDLETKRPLAAYDGGSGIEVLAYY
jgi:DNA-binding beta-propeller fold protein YncE